MINPHIFRQYDIRGIVNIDLTEKTVSQLALSFGSYMREKGFKTLVVGSDCRLSSDGFRDIFSRFMQQTGCAVIDVGVVPTPVLYFAIEQLNADGGVMITGSHNPPEFNGFKLCVGSFSIFGDEIQKIRLRINDGVYFSGTGSYTHYPSIIAEYQNYLIQHFSINRPLTVVIDSGNGTAGPVAPGIFRKLGCNVVSLYDEMDGTFPHHHPDPTVPEYMHDLIQAVKNHKADLGIGFDGDADRIGVINEQGKMILGDQLLTIFARDILPQYPNASIISEVKSSQTLYDAVAHAGGQPIMWKTGHSLIKEKMKRENAPLGGEMSGHMFFADRYFGFDDAIYAAGRLLEIVSKENRNISQLLSDIPQMYNTPEIRMDCNDSHKFTIVEQLKNQFPSKYPMNTIDGIRITFPHGWALVRASNTQPVLVLRFESSSSEELERIQAFVMKKVKDVMKKYHE